jgi:CDP-diacylglycerol--glycerol-3-phosphate 3-phosphatidyltransferase
MFDGRWRHAVDLGTQPVGKALVRARITADVLTAFGLAMSVVMAVVVGTGHLAIGIALLFATGLPDLFDGPVAKASGTASVRGAFFDSVADRFSDAFMFGGVAWYLGAHHEVKAELLPFAILALTALISYQRAKAELLGLSAKGGLMERAERFILLGLCYIAGVFSMTAFIVSLWVFLALVLITALGRFVKVMSAAEGPVREPREVRVRAEVDSESAHSGHLAEVSRRALARWREGNTDSRWRAWREARAQRDPDVPRVNLPRRSGDPSGKWWPRREGSTPSEVAGERRRARLERPRSRPSGRTNSERRTQR